MTDWIRVKKNNLCPICEKGDWCSISADGQVVHCMRVESSKPVKSGGWIHKLSEPVPEEKRRYWAGDKRKPQNVDWCRLLEKFENNLTERLLSRLSGKLGVSELALQSMEVGYDKSKRAYTFPMRNERLQCVGFRLRAADKKLSITGSQNAMFLPSGYLGGGHETLFICEGPTDCAAMLDMNFMAVGRPSCSGAVEMTRNLLKLGWHDVVIVADNDEGKQRPDGTDWFPGMEGAEKLAEEIKDVCRTVRVIQPEAKDIRALYREKGDRTGPIVTCLVQAARKI